jgi:predicted dehydrogenase
MNPHNPHRRSFLKHTAAAATLIATATRAQDAVPKRVKTAVIGCGSVSTKYFPNLAQCPFVELVSTCDIIPERAEKAAKQHKIPNQYPHIDALLSGAPFDLLVNLTDMQEHEHLNKQAIAAGKHIWSEKPIANTLAAGQQLLMMARAKGIRLWGAPTPVHSPQFAFMAKTLASGALGKLSVAAASYGHLGPTWSSFFYETGGGSLPDLGVYNLTTLTGLLGPARSVSAMTSIVTPTRTISRKGQIKVTAEDNASVLLDHGNGVISHTQCGFNFFTAKEHDFTDNAHHTITIMGTAGSMAMCGYDWAPHAVDLATRQKPKFERHCDEKHDYVWQNGASLVAECLSTGKEPLFTPEHALHVVEIITAARSSQETGRRIDLTSTFKWPILP